MVIYEPTAESKIIHYSNVDFSKRFIQTPIHIVQYDDSLPVLAVNLYNNDEIYILPDNAEVEIRYTKDDKTAIVMEAIGISIDKTVVYFTIGYQMTAVSGKFDCVLSVKLNGTVAATSQIIIKIDENPISDNDIKSTTEYPALRSYAQSAKDYAEQVHADVEGALKARDRAIEAEANAKASEEAASLSADSAKASENNTSTALDSINKQVEHVDSQVKHIDDQSKIVDQQVTDTKTYLDKATALVAKALTHSFVSSLPTSDIDPNNIYFVKDASAKDLSDSYKEWMYDETNSKWELVGHTGGGGGAVSSANIVLRSAGWTSLTQTIAVNDILASSVVYPAAFGTNAAKYDESGVYGDSLADGSITFKCASVPSADISVNLLIAQE